MKKKRRRARNSTGERWVQFPSWLLTDEDWRKLSSRARSIFVDICTRWNGVSEYNNNGRISYGCRTAKGIGISKSQAARALNELVASNLLVMTCDSWFMRDDRHTREWRITIFPVYGSSKLRTRVRKDGTKDPHHIRLYSWLLQSPAYRAASNAARSILFELMRRYDGNNNGALSFGGKDAAPLGVCRNAAERALRELEQFGFIVATASEHPNLGLPRTWRLTMYDMARTKASKEFMRALQSPSQKSLLGPTCGDITPRQVPSAVTQSSSHQPPRKAPKPEDLNQRVVLGPRSPISHVTAGGTYPVPRVTSCGTHLEAMSLGGPHPRHWVPSCFFPSQHPASSPACGTRLRQRSLTRTGGSQ
jgi:hypothetical protein